LGTQIRGSGRVHAAIRIHDLVYAEFHETMPLAIAREKQIKKWRRAWKLALIEEANPEWRDLSGDVLR
jgi:putative endonuclease